MHCLIHFPLFKSFLFCLQSVLSFHPPQELESKWLRNRIEVLKKCLFSCRKRQQIAFYSICSCLSFILTLFPNHKPPSLEIIHQLQGCLLQHPYNGILFVTGNKMNIFLFYKISYNADKDSHYHEQFSWLVFIYKYPCSHASFNKTGIFTYVN